MFKKCDTFTREIKRGDIYCADLPYDDGHVQGGIRPVLVIQNDIGNKYSPTVIVAPLTTKEKKPLPTHTVITARTKSVCLCEQQTTIDKSRLKEYVTSTTEAEMHKVDIALAVSIGLGKILDMFKGGCDKEVSPCY